MTDTDTNPLVAFSNAIHAATHELATSLAPTLTSIYDGVTPVFSELVKAANAIYEDMTPKQRAELHQAIEDVR